MYHRTLSATVATALSLVALALSTGCSSSKSTGQEPRDTVTLMGGLRFIEYEQGKGDFVTAGMTVRVDYAGYLTNGRLFDTSIDSVGGLHDRNGFPFPADATETERRARFDRNNYPFQPIEFVVGKGNVIAGWDEGLTTNMRIGGRRRLIIPPELGYGPSGSGAIPPNATLIFDVYVISAR